MEVRELGERDLEALRAYLRGDPCRNAYLLGLLHWFGIAGPRTRFLGALADGALVGALAEGAEVHCWYASVAADAPPIARALGVAMTPHVSVLLADEPLAEAVLEMIPSARRQGVARMVFSTRSVHPDYPAPAYPVRRATPDDLRALVDLYEGYEMDGYPTRRHLHRALVERLRHTAIFVVERDDRLVAAERVDGGNSEVWVTGGLTTHPAHRGRGLGHAVRLGLLRECRRRSIRTIELRDPRNPLYRRTMMEPTGWWLVANLAVPSPPVWHRLATRVLGRVSPWDRPCQRRPMTFLEQPVPPTVHHFGGRPASPPVR